MVAYIDCAVKLIEHLSYSLHQTFTCFQLKMIIFSNFQWDEDVIYVVEDFLNCQEKDIFISGFEALKHLWQKCVDTEEGLC
jgi:hypothetical protein